MRVFDTRGRNIINANGLHFAWETKHDEGMGPPWKEHDGHGEVREVSYRHSVYGAPSKRPGERVLHADRGYAYLYDWKAAIKTALEDGWGLDEAAKVRLAERLGHMPSKREIAVQAVNNDFEHLRRWLNDDWYWCGVVVTLLDIEGNETGETESLWGIESDSDDYHEEVAQELADELADRIGDAKELRGPVIRQQQEVHHG